MAERMPNMTVAWDPEYLPYIYSADDRDCIIKSLVRQLMPYWKKGKAFGCVCPDNFTIIQKDHRLFAQLHTNAMDQDSDYESPDIEKTPASDIFSLGLVWHVLFSETLPYWKSNAEYPYTAVRAGEKLEVFDYLDDLHFNLISRMLEKDPTIRISPEELLASLAAKRTIIKYRRPHDGTAEIRITVTTDEGEPLPDTLVDVYHPKSDQSFYNKTGSNGQVSMQIASGECWLSIFHEGYGMRDRHFFIYADDTMEFTVTMSPEEYTETSFTYDEDIPF